MKLVKLVDLFYYFIIICIFSSNLCSNVNILKQIDNSKEGAKEGAKNYINFARLPYCKTTEIQSKTCEVCRLINEQGYKVIYVESQQKDDIIFTMVISASETGEVVISFGGPKSENVSYLQQIYANGIQKVSEINNILIENEFWNVYSTFFRQNLLSSLSELKTSASKIIFVGHSFGGSLAFLSAYDSVVNHVLEESMRPYIYTYGALKIGTSDFSKIIHRIIGRKLIRIRRRIDFFTLMPRCIYIPELTAWQCYRNYVNLVKAFPMFAYYYYRFSPYIRKQLIHHIPRIIRKAKSYLNKAVNLQTKKQVKVKVAKKSTHVRQIEKRVRQIHPKKYSELNSVLKNQKKPMDRVFINEISEHLTHNNINQYNQKKFNKSLENKTLANNTPLKYPGLKSNSEISQLSLTHQNIINRKPYKTEELLAPHKSLKNSMSWNKLNNESKQFSSYHNRKTFNDRNSNIHFHEEKEKKRLQSYPQSYPQSYAQSYAKSYAQSYAKSYDPKTSSGIDYHSGSKSHTPIGHNSNGLSTRKIYSIRKKRAERLEKRKRSFLQTSITIKNNMKKAKQIFFKSCIKYENFVRCKFEPEIHRIFFGIDIESC